MTPAAPKPSLRRGARLPPVPTRQASRQHECEHAAAHSRTALRRLPPGMKVLAACPADHALVLVQPQNLAPPDRNPALVYLASLGSGSRTTMRAALDSIAEILVPGSDAISVPWHHVKFQHTAAVRSRLSEKYAPASCNKMLAALRGVLRAAFALGMTSADTFTRAVSVKAVRGHTLPAGRALSYGEIRALFGVCESARPGRCPRRCRGRHPPWSWPSPLRVGGVGRRRFRPGNGHACGSREGAEGAGGVPHERKPSCPRRVASPSGALAGSYDPPGLERRSDRSPAHGHPGHL